MKTINPVQLEHLLEDDATVEVLDIRPRNEFQSGHIPGAHSLTNGEISAEAVTMSRQLLNTEPLYIVSQTGTEALCSAYQLECEGLDNLVIVSGGMRAWKQQHLPMVRSDFADD